MTETTDAPRDLLALVRAAIAECEGRLTVCEAQQAGPWRTTGGRRCHAISRRDRKEAVGVSSEEAFIYSTPRDYVCLPETWEQQIADAEGMTAQRTERPQELRVIIGTLRKIEKAASWGLTDFDVDILDGIVRELGVRA